MLTGSITGLRHDRRTQAHLRRKNQVFEEETTGAIACGINKLLTNMKKAFVFPLFVYGCSCCYIIVST